MNDWYDLYYATHYPEDELDEVIEWLGDDDPLCVTDAIHLQLKWERNDTPLHVRCAEVDAFFVKWNFVGGPMPKLRRKAFRTIQGGKR
jgi:hypothetical protein